MPFLAPLVAFFAYSTVGGIILSVGTSFVLKGISGLFGKGGSQPSLAHDTANHQVTVRQPTAPRRVVYGKDNIGGIITFIALSGASNEFLHVVVTFTGHEIDAFEEIWLGEDLLTLDGSGNATGKYAGFVTVEQKLGAAGEAAFPGLIAALPAKWTSNHKQEGCASLHVQLKNSSELFPSGLPNIKALIRGKLIYDWRTSTTAWSDNAALCLADYLTTASTGLGSSTSELDSTLAQAAANVCDELVGIHGSTTEKRYRCWGTFDLSERPGDIIKALCASMSGRCTWVGSKWRTYAGAWRAPVLAFDDNDFRQGAIVYNARRSRRDICNGVKGTFVDPLNKWQPTDFPAFTLSSSRGYAQDDYFLEDGSERIWRDVEMRFVKWASQCQRLAKIELLSSRRQGNGSLPFNLSAYTAAPTEVIQVSHSRFGWSAKTFETTELALVTESGADGAPLIAVNANVVETDAAVYAWSATDDLAPNVPADLPLPTGDNAGSAGSLTATNNGSGSVTLHWPLSTDDSVYSDGHWQIYYKLHSASTYVIAGSPAGDQISFTIAGLSGGSAYDFSIRSRNIDNIPSSFTYLLNWTVT